MKKKSKDNFILWLSLAGKALEMDMNSIKAEFYDYWLYIETYYEKGLKYTHIDIRLNDSTKLSCLLDKTNRCKSSTLYLPQVTEINQCITLLKYSLPLRLYSWKLGI